MTKLSLEARKIINDYLALPFPGHNVTTPYFNNQRAKVRAALRVLIGKGSPHEIVDEARIIALRDHVDLKKLDNAGLKKFLVEHNLGVDCSALAYYILDAESQARGLGALKKYLIFPEAQNPIRKILTKFRPVENTSVATFAHEKNSKAVLPSDIQAGDFIILWRTGNEHKLNHILIVHAVEAKKISYTHSFRWSTEGMFEHGVRQGTIIITDSTKPLVEQIWEEKNKIGADNETLEHAQLAEQLEIRRLHTF